MEFNSFGQGRHSSRAAVHLQGLVVLVPICPIRAFVSVIAEARDRQNETCAEWHGMAWHGGVESRMDVEE